MNLQKRQARAKRKAKTARMAKQFPRMPQLRSKWTYMRGFRADRLTPGEVQGVRRVAVHSFVQVERAARLEDIPPRLRRGWQRREE
jgi:hypothetical protein